MEKYVTVLKKIANEGHRFNPPLTLQEVIFFEQKYGVDLPKSYRDFLLNVADGGIMIDGCKLLCLSEIDVDSANIHKPFPLQQHWVWEDDDSVDKEKQMAVYHGQLPLIDIGDCQTWNLIATGNCTGEMWFFTDVGVQPACPRRYFLSWFEFWLYGGEDFFPILFTKQSAF